MHKCAEIHNAIIGRQALSASLDTQGEKAFAMLFLQRDSHPLPLANLDVRQQNLSGIRAQREGTVVYAGSRRDI